MKEERKYNTTIAAVFALSRSSSLAGSLSDSQGLYLNIPSSSFTQCNLRLNSHWLPTKSRDRNEDHDFRVSGNFSEAFVCLIHFFVLVYSVLEVQDLLKADQYYENEKNKKAPERNGWKKRVNLEQRGEAGGQYSTHGGRQPSTFVIWRLALVHHGPQVLRTPAGKLTTQPTGRREKERERVAVKQRGSRLVENSAGRR
ncbi:hypothetical protein E2C01_055233 [Portunus trituberculatus]|uniref:Uncharacterized protein n=1 Tax=Portunus trituberculatus TaxID=210409 RepID=A0A5B7GUA2_PORTR|nr:hypothetical protein [Portunus trituberculatus]